MARLAGWRRVTRQVWFCTWWTVRTACHFFTAPFALTGAGQLRADGMTSCCYIINVHNLMSWAASRKEGMAWYSSKPMPYPTSKAVLIIIDWLSHCHLNSWMISVPEFIDPVLCENKPETLVFYDWKGAFWAGFFCENWVYKFGHWLGFSARVSCWLARPIANKVLLPLVDQHQLLPQLLADLLGLSSVLFPCTLALATNHRSSFTIGCL